MKSKRTTPHLPGAIVLLSPLLRDLVSGTGARVIVLNDNLLVGPCARGHKAHRALRRLYWTRAPTCPRLPYEGPLEVWLPRAWYALIQLWRIADELRERVQHVDVILFGQRPQESAVDIDPPPREQGELVGPKSARRRRHVSRAILEKWSNLWVKYCASSPGCVSRRLLDA